MIFYFHIISIVEITTIPQYRYFCGYVDSKKEKNRLKSKINDAFLTTGMQSSPEENLSVSPSRIRSIPLSLSLYSCLFPFFLRFPFLWVFLLFCVGKPRSTAAERRGGGGGGDGGEGGGGGGEFRPTRFTERRNGSERTRNQRRGPREQRAPRDLRARTVSLLPVPWICFFFIPFSLSFSFLLFQRFFSCFFQSITVGTVRLISRQYQSKGLRIKKKGLVNNLC